ncbi:BatD family protein, partial [Stenotrophomonas pictorum]
MKSRKTRGWLLWPLLAVWLLGSGLAVAETRMWLDRDSLAEGESTTLLIETDQAGVSPDYTPLQADFILNGQRSSRQWQLANGRRVQKSLFEVSLTPRHAGVLAVPALRVGSERSGPLRL